MPTRRRRSSRKPAPPSSSSSPLLDHVTVERDGDDLVVSWDGDGEVVVRVGPSPDEIGPLTVPADGPNSARIRDVDAGVRHYVRVEAGDGQAVVVAERLVPLTGTLNFRDLGGYRTSEGRRVRWGRIYRSDGLDQLTDADHVYLAHLGLRVVCDLRGDTEVAAAPSRLPPGLAVRRFSVGEDPSDTRPIVERLAAGEITEFTADAMAGMYALMLEVGAPAFGGILRTAADEANLPLVFHCAAGKDRTGILSALLLRLLGVDEGTVLDDYELTTRYRSQKRLAVWGPKLAEAGIDIERIRPVFTAERPVLAATLGHIEDRWGSVEGYLRGPAGVDDGVVTGLRTALLL